MPGVEVNSIVVGVDGSPTSLRAVTWAAELADTLSVPLDVLAAYGAPLTLEIYATFSSAYREHVHDSGRAHLDAGLEAARAAAPDLELNERYVDRPPVRALLEAGAADRLLVVGRHGVGGGRMAKLGSVTDQVVTHAHGPVVVVPPDPVTGDRIVVGVDASPHSSAALWFAFELARTMVRPVTLIHSWGYDTVWLDAPVGVEPEDLVDVRARAERAAHSVADPIVARYDDVDVEWLMERNTPAQSLMDAADTASMLVVGRRGHGGFPALLLGSTSRALTHAAPCPVAVIPS